MKLELTSFAIATIGFLGIAVMILISGIMINTKTKARLLMESQ